MADPFEGMSVEQFQEALANAQGKLLGRPPMRAAVVGVSLKQATRERPGRSEGALVRNAPSQLAMGKARTPVQGQLDITVCALWTAAEFRTFRHLMDRVMSPVISEKASGEVWLRRFKEKHGNEICEMMLAELRRQDELEWFKQKREAK